jgi:hypothetical protein
MGFLTNWGGLDSTLMNAISVIGVGARGLVLFVAFYLREQKRPAAVPGLAESQKRQGGSMHFAA